jgi:phage terminase small subunit
MVQLSNRHENFARAYLKHNNNILQAGRACEITADYAKKLARRPDIQARIVELRKRQLGMADITGQRVMLELARVGFSDIRSIYNEDGRLKPIHELDADAAASIAGMEFEERMEKQIEEDLATGEPVVKWVPVRTVKVKRYDKNPSLLTLAKHFKLVGDEGDGVNALASALADRLKLARRRAEVIEAEDVPQLENSDESK